MKPLGKLAIVALLGASAVALSATAVSARVVCNQWGECWHVRNGYDYKPEFGLVVHEDNWRWGAGEHYRWHEHHGRGYWRNGVWIRF